LATAQFQFPYIVGVQCIYSSLQSWINADRVTAAATAAVRVLERY